MKRSLLLPLILLCGLWACTSRQPLKIGFVGGLTGRTSQLGILARNGVELAVEEANRAGGVRGRLLKLLIRDDQNDHATAVRVDRELMDEGVLAIIGHVTSSMAEAALEAIE